MNKCPDAIEAIRQLERTQLSPVDSERLTDLMQQVFGAAMAGVTERPYGRVLQDIEDMWHRYHAIRLHGMEESQC